MASLKSEIRRNNLDLRNETQLPRLFFAPALFNVYLCCPYCWFHLRRDFYGKSVLGSRLYRKCSEALKNQPLNVVLITQEFQAVTICKATIREAGYAQ